MEPFAEQDEYVGFLRQQIRYSISRARWLAEQTKALMEAQFLIDRPWIERFSEFDGLGPTADLKDENSENRDQDVA